MPASRYRSLSPITEKRCTKRHKSDRHFSMKGIRACMRCYSNNGCWREVIVRLIRADQLCRLHATHNRQRIIRLRRVGYSNRFTSGTQEQRLAIRTSMMSNGRFRPTRALNASTASDPFSTISTVCPYFRRILTTTFWFTRLSSANRISNFTSFVGATGLTVVNSKAR